MKANFAKGIAINISEIVQATTERLMPFQETSDLHSARLANCDNRIKIAEDRLAQWLMQPGPQFRGPEHPESPRPAEPMQTWTVTMHRDDGEPATVYYPDSDTAAGAMLEAAKYAVLKRIPVKTVEIDQS